jgi:hypothetical protein
MKKRTNRLRTKKSVQITKTFSTRLFYLSRIAATEDSVREAASASTALLSSFESPTSPFTQTFQVVSAHQAANGGFLKMEHNTENLG